MEDELEFSEKDAKRIKRLLEEHNLEGVNKPKRLNNHPTKRGIVLAKDGGKVKLIRFGDANATTAGKPSKNDSEKDKARRKSFKARHAKNIAKGKLSGAYWADKMFWTEDAPKEEKYYSEDQINNWFEEWKQMKGDDPCWKGYEMVGTKIKKGKKVPNCVPKKK